MPHAPYRRWLLLGLLLVISVSLGHGQAQEQSPAGSAISTPTKSQGFSRRDLVLLRPVLLRDLIPTIKLVDNEPKPSASDVQDAFLSCRFTPLSLGQLGPVVLVEWDGGFTGSINVPMLNIYIASGGSYRKIIEEGGFGPGIVPRANSAPDLLFGSTSGVCHATITRYRFADGKYAPDACDQEFSSNSVSVCQVKPCGEAAHSKPLPTFPDPTSWAGPPNTPAPYFSGPTLTAKQILSANH